MATVAGVKIKTKVTKTRNPIFFDEKYTGGEPQWDTDRALNFTDAQFDHCLRQSFYYYNYYYSQKDCKKYVVEWMKTRENFDKDQVRSFERSSDRWLPMTACSLIMAHRIGMPLKPRHIEFLNKSLLEVIAQSDAEPQEVVAVATKAGEPYRPTIQDRLNEKTSETIGEIEGVYDEVSTGQKADFKPYDFLTINKVPQSQLGKYEAVFAKRKAELEEAQAKADPQLKEAYSHYKAADFKRLITWIDNLLAGIEQYRGVKKATKKAAVRKAPSKEKLVAKLKYAKEDRTLKVVSVNPADIIGASELWVYNIKTRKLGKYVAASYQTLNIKGTTIVGYDEDKSVAKTLRKPDEQLKEFARAGKVALRTWIKDIKAVEIKLTGRINEDTLLLKVG
jgi:hypothetical protein